MNIRELDSFYMLKHDVDPKVETMGDMIRLEVSFLNGSTSVITLTKDDGIKLITGELSQGFESGEESHLEVDGQALSSLCREFTDRFCRVRYWVSTEQLTLEQAMEHTAAIALGSGDVRFTIHGSEITGYMWTDDWFRIGGHNLVQELSNHMGKYLLMEIETFTQVS